MKEEFIGWIKNTGLWVNFIIEFGDNWESNSFYADGWYFEEDNISYRECDVYDDYRDGYNWKFQEDYLNDIIYRILLSHGFEEVHNSGDDEDNWFCMKKPDMTKLKRKLLINLSKGDTSREIGKGEVYEQYGYLEAFIALSKINKPWNLELIDNNIKITIKYD